MCGVFGVFLDFEVDFMVVGMVLDGVEVVCCVEEL